MRDPSLYARAASVPGYRHVPALSRPCGKKCPAPCGSVHEPCLNGDAKAFATTTNTRPVHCTPKKARPGATQKDRPWLTSPRRKPPQAPARHCPERHPEVQSPRWERRRQAALQKTHRSERTSKRAQRPRSKSASRSGPWAAEKKPCAYFRSSPTASRSPP